MLINDNKSININQIMILKIEIKIYIKIYNLILWESFWFFYNINNLNSIKKNYSINHVVLMFWILIKKIWKELE
jgi:hypothetical protein